jgi:hypothetical protein
MSVLNDTATAFTPSLPTPDTLTLKCVCPQRTYRGKACKHEAAVARGEVRLARLKGAAPSPGPSPVADLWGAGGASLDRAIARQRGAA